VGLYCLSESKEAFNCPTLTIVLVLMVMTAILLFTEEVTVAEPVAGYYYLAEKHI
jgi:hypothetical protein